VSSHLETLPRRLDTLTSLRWFAAFIVFLFHMRSFAPLPFITPLFTVGNYGVTFFFILSGFVLTYADSGRQMTGTFYWRRFSRIWPATFVALLLALPVFYSFNPNPAQWWVNPVNVPVLLLSVPVIQGWWVDPQILFSGNPVAWSLTVEFFFYALFPLLILLMNRLRMRGLLWLGVAVLTLAVIYQFGMWQVPGLGLSNIPQPVVHLGEFVLGIALAQAVRLGYISRIPSWVSLSLTGVLMLAIGINTAYHRTGFVAQLFDRLSTPLIIAAFTFVIASVAAREIRHGASVLTWRPLVILGEWSFAFYLVHSTVIYFTRGIVGTLNAQWSNLLWYAGLLVGSLIVAAGLHLLIEKPIEKRMRAWWDRRKA